MNADVLETFMRIQGVAAAAEDQFDRQVDTSHSANIQ